MKTVFFAVFLLIASSSFCQQTSSARDSVARDAAFQLKVKMRALSAANDLLADNAQPVYVINYAQLIVTDPNGGSWLPALSYGCMTNVAINFDSSESDIQYTINSIFVKYAKAYYRVSLVSP